MLDRLAGFVLDREQRHRGLSPTPELEEAHRSSRGRIETALAETELFHGTGRFRYAPVDGSKYNGIDPNKHVDVLERILTEGLRPQEDLFSEVFTGEPQPSVSLSPARMYARVYAKQFEAEEGETLQYEYGSQAFWWQYFAFRMALDMVTDPAWYGAWIQSGVNSLLQTENYKKRRSVLDRLHARWDAWQRTFRSDDRYTRRSMDLMCFGRSTIPENHGMIVGVKAEAVKPLAVLHGYVRRYEVRTGEPILPDQLSFLEVPMAVVERTRALVEASEVPDLPVFPMEAMELHHQGRPFDELTAAHPYRNEPELLTA